MFYARHTAVSGPTQNMTSSRRRPGSPWACRARSSPFLWKGVAPNGDGVWVNWRIRANTTTLPLPVALPFASEGELKKRLHFATVFNNRPRPPLTSLRDPTEHRTPEPSTGPNEARAVVRAVECTDRRRAARVVDHPGRSRRRC